MVLAGLTYYVYIYGYQKTGWQERLYKLQRVGLLADGGKRRTERPRKT